MLGLLDNPQSFVVFVKYLPGILGAMCIAGITATVDHNATERVLLVLIYLSTHLSIRKST